MSQSEQVSEWKSFRESMIKELRSYHGCLTGDCPHNNQDQCDVELFNCVADMVREYERKRADGLIKALEFECGNRCDAHYNPCNAREALNKYEESQR